MASLKTTFTAPGTPSAIGSQGAIQDESGWPDESDVATGLVYGPNLEFTGTASLAVVPTPTLYDTPEENVRELLANCDEFMAATGTATVASATDFIGIPFDPASERGGESIAAAAFRACVGEDEQSSVINFGTNSAATSGSIPLYFYDGIGSGDTEEEAFVNFKKQIVAITNEMRFKDGPFIIVQSITAVEPPTRTRNEQGDSVLRFVAKFTVQHGVDGF